MATVPSAGTYRLFFHFQHKEGVRTAAFTVRTRPTSAPGTPVPPTRHGSAHRGHHNHEPAHHDHDH